MDDKTKDIATLSLEEWKQLTNQIRVENFSLVNQFVQSVNDPKVVDMIAHATAMVSGNTIGAISEKLFPDVELI